MIRYSVNLTTFSCVLPSILKLGVVLFVVTVLFLVPSNTFAVDEEKEESSVLTSFANLPEGVPSLPAPRADEARFLINKTNVASFHQILLAPIASWFASEGAVFTTVRNLDFYWNLSEQWNKNSEKNVGLYELGGNNGLQAMRESVPPDGFPFGDKSHVDGIKDPRRKAFQILWNSQFALSATKDLLYGLELQWVGRRGLVRSAAGAYFRTYAPMVGKVILDESKPLSAVSDATLKLPAPKQPDSSPYMMQDVLKLFNPAGVYGFAAVSHRYLSSKEDDYWIYSPVLAKSRRVLSSNRSDGLIGNELTYDDLFTWAMKIQSVDAQVVEDKTLLLPFSSLDMLRLNKEDVSVRVELPKSSSSSSKKIEQEELDVVDGATSTEQLEEDEPMYKELIEKVLTVRGYYKRPDRSSAMVLWNHETKRYPKVASWIPVSAFFVPREVWIIEVSPLDPYYQSGRQILVIDKESFLPFYKIVYNAKGEYDRIVMTGWGLAASQTGAQRMSIPGFVLSVRREETIHMCLTVKYGRTFLGKETPALLDMKKMLDITSHGTD